MPRMKRTKRRRVGVGVSSGTKQQSLQGFDIELVLSRARDEVPSDPSRLKVAISKGQYNDLTRQAIPPVSSLKALVRSQRRPNSGTFDEMCTLKTNHFVVKLLKKKIYQYDVCISPDVSSSDVNRAVMKELVSIHRYSDLGGFLPAYDGRRRLYTAGKLPDICKKFKIKLQDGEVILGDGQKPWRHIRVQQFEVVIKPATSIKLQPLVNVSWKREDQTQKALQVLDIILSEICIEKHFPFPQSLELGVGLKIYQGLYKSLQLTPKGLLLNIDVSSTVSIKPMDVTDYIAQVLGRRIINEPLCDADRLKIKEALKDVLVQFQGMQKKYRVVGLTSDSMIDLTVPIDESGTSKEFVPFFQDTLKYTINYTHLPCLEVCNKQTRIFLPIEVCKIAEGQSYSKKLNQKQMSALLQIARLYPRQREHHTEKTLQYNNYFEDDPYLKDFGVVIEQQLLPVKAHLKFHDKGMHKKILPQEARWNMVRKRMFNCGRVSNWTCVNFSSDVGERIIRSFCHELTVMCKASGIDFSVDPVLPVVTYPPQHVESAIKSCYLNVMEKLRPLGKELDLLIVILPNKKDSLYGTIKRMCETEIGLVSQCCLAKNVLKTVKQRKTCKQYLVHVALKINVKVGGKNTILNDTLTRRLPCVGDVPTIIFGAHVMHPEKVSNHSIAAVVASQDWPEVANYAALAGLQARCQELIQDLFQAPLETGATAGGMIIKHLISFKRANGCKPQRIIFYRDAVSNGQLYKVMWQELTAIKKACSYLEADYNPAVTYVVLEKHHHTRFFVDKYDDETFFCRGKLLPGTVIEDLHRPDGFGFYLFSRNGPTQGMARSVHYHVLWDENIFPGDAFQCLTNYLCYTYARCTHSVSIVPPVYYARLMASRGRLYMECTPSDSAQMASGVASTSDSVAVPRLPDVKDNLKKVSCFTASSIMVGMGSLCICLKNLTL